MNTKRIEGAPKWHSRKRSIEGRPWPQRNHGRALRFVHKRLAGFIVSKCWETTHFIHDPGTAMLPLQRQLLKRCPCEVLLCNPHPLFGGPLRMVLSNLPPRSARSPLHSTLLRHQSRKKPSFMTHALLQPLLFIPPCKSAVAV